MNEGRQKIMCPVCIATVVFIAGSAASGGGLAAVAMKKIGVKKEGDKGRMMTTRLPSALREAGVPEA